jgi:ADP-ribosylglycohydrolase
MRRASGCLFGLAFGDALGAKTEFLSVEEIIHSVPPQGPKQLEDNPALVTDDTQMTLALGEALVAAAYKEYTATTLEPALREAFVDWYNSPDNNREPGMTCLSACKKLATGIPWHQATVLESKGCGANMRVAPVAFLAMEQQGAIAQFQAALTHGHPTALAASDLTAKAIYFLLQGCQIKELPAQLRNYAHQQRTIYHHDWLGNLWQRPYTKTPQEFISRGWDECLEILDRLDAALIQPDYDRDPCLATGAGWIAEEAFGTGLLCFLLYPEEPVKALQRAAVTSGDSDSIACLTGAFAGSYLGMSVWSEDWISKIEYRERLEELGKFWD